MPINIQIIYQDEALLVINKPSGILSLPDGYNHDAPHIRSILEPEYGRLYIVHRLDKETSGVMILCKTLESHNLINSQFENRQVHKEYHTIIYCPRKGFSPLTVDTPLRVNGDRRHRTIVSQVNGKSASTVFRPLEQFSQVTLISARPLTGYTHQIRAHLYSQGYQILGDKLYNLHDNNCISVETALDVQRLLLHAYRIEFTHPVTQKMLILTAEYPSDFSITLEKIKQTEPTPK